MGLGINLRITHFLSGIVLREQKPITPPNEEHKDTEGLREHDRQSECTWLSLLLSLESCWRLPGSLDPLAASSAPEVTVELGVDLGLPEGPEDPLCWWPDPPEELGDWLLPERSLPLSRECPEDPPPEEDLSSP